MSYSFIFLVLLFLLLLLLTLIIFKNYFKMNDLNILNEINTLKPRDFYYLHNMNPYKTTLFSYMLIYAIDKLTDFKLPKYIEESQIFRMRIAFVYGARCICNYLVLNDYERYMEKTTTLSIIKKEFSIGFVLAYLSSADNAFKTIKNFTQNERIVPSPPLKVIYVLIELAYYGLFRGTAWATFFATKYKYKLFDSNLFAKQILSFFSFSLAAYISFPICRIKFVLYDNLTRDNTWKEFYNSIRLNKSDLFYPKTYVPRKYFIAESVLLTTLDSIYIL